MVVPLESPLKMTRRRLTEVVHGLVPPDASSDEPPDPWTIVQRNHLRVTYLADVDVPADLCSLHTAGEIFLPGSVQTNDFEHRKSLWHALAHVALTRTVAGAAFWPDLETEFARVTIELAASEVESMLAIPGKALLAFALARPLATNFDGARFFGVQLHVFTRRIAEAIHGFWAGDPRYDKPILRKLLGRCLGRVDVVGRRRIDEFVDRDPDIMADDLINAEARDLIDLFNRFARFGNAEAAHSILLSLRQTSSKTLRAIVEHQSLRDTKRLLGAFDLLPEGEARLARAIFFEKIGYLNTAEEELPDLSRVSKETAADARAVRGRIQKLRGNLGEAIKECRLARELDPFNSEALGGEINARIALDHGEQVRELLEPLRETELRAMYFEGKLAEKESRLGDARNAYILLTQWTDHPFFRKALTRLAAISVILGGDAEALMLYGFLNVQFPMEAETLSGYVPLLLRNGRRAEAVRLLLDATRVCTIQGWAFRTLGDVYSRVSLPELAAAFWAQADLLEPSGGWRPQVA